MIANLPPYPAYKSSGVDWLGDVPAHWEQLPGRACYTEKKILNVGMQESTVLSLSYGRIVVRPPEKLRGLVPESFETYQIIGPGDIVVRATDLQNDWNSLRFGLCRRRGIITSAYICLKANGVMSRDFGHLLLHSYDLKKVFYGLGSGLRQNLSWDDFRYLPCLVPPLAEQRAIARYLDHVDRRIQRYIEAKEQLIALLQEARQAIIQRAVTRGLDPDVPLKPSGVDWLGDVPSHWEVRRLRDSVLDCVGGVWGSEPNGIDDLPCVRVADFDRQRLRVHMDAPTIRAIAPSERRQRILASGDLLLEKSGGGALQPVGVVMLYDHGRAAVCSNFVALLRVSAGFDPVFLTFLHSALYALRLNVRSIKQTTGIQNLDTSAYLRERVCIPPLPEQRAIASHLDQATAAIDSAIDNARRQSERMAEYRASLIAHVVTGKLDVRAAAAQLPADSPAETPVPEQEEDRMTTDTSESGLEPPDLHPRSPATPAVRPRQTRCARERLRPVRAGSAAIRTTTTATTALTSPSSAPSCSRRNLRQPTCSAWGKTAPRGASSWPGCRARSTSAAP